MSITITHARPDRQPWRFRERLHKMLAFICSRFMRVRIMSIAFQKRVCRRRAASSYTNDVFNSGTDAWYYAVGGEWALPQDFTLSANVGWSIALRLVQRSTQQACRKWPIGRSGPDPARNCCFQARVSARAARTGYTTLEATHKHH